MERSRDAALVALNAFGPIWKDCEQFLGRLGCTEPVEVTSS